MNDEKKHKEHHEDGSTVPAGSGEKGFTLIETAVALVIILIALLGVFYAFTYSIMYNAGNASRAQALAVMQKEVEVLRSAKFTPSFTDPLLTGGVKAAKTVTAADGFVFRIEDTVDNDPFTDGVQTDDTVGPTIKEVTITVTLDAPSPGWQTAVPATVIVRRTRGN
jgi:prepilin-type N-terminal cleavage/methylation domain-containing protein